MVETQSPRGGHIGRDTEGQSFHDMHEQVEEQVFHEDREVQSSNVDPELCIDEVEEKDMMRKRLVH